MITSISFELTAFTSIEMVESVYVFSALRNAVLGAASVYYSSLGSRTRALCPSWMGPNRQQPSRMVDYGKSSLSANVGPFLLPVRKFRSLYFLSLWQFHYIHRAFIYPLTLKSEKNVPFMIILMAFLFNIVNAYLNGLYLILNEKTYTLGYLSNWNFILGASLFVIGFWVIKNLIDC